MALQRITPFFDSLRAHNLQELRDRLPGLTNKMSFTTDLSRKNLVDFLQRLFSGSFSWFVLEDHQVDQILGQLHRSLEGNIFESNTFIALWKFWLRENPTKKATLAVVDVQNDFISGSLALKNCPTGEDGYEVIPIINNILNQGLFDEVVYSLDWHPSDHCSFVDNVSLYPLHASSPVSAEKAKIFDTVIYSKPVVIKQKLWPAHCIQGTWGAELHKELKSPETKDLIIKKGNLSHIDSYSAFWSNGHYCHTELFIDLLKKGVTDIYICGLALDYCVKFTAEDAAQHGFDTYLVVDACRSTCKEGHSETAYGNIKKCGVTFLKCSDIEKQLLNTKQ